MIKARIDATAYPVIRIASPNKLTIPLHAIRLLEFDPTPKESDFLIYFMEDENEDEKFHNTFTWCRNVDLFEHIRSTMDIRQVRRQAKLDRDIEQMDRRLDSIKQTD